MSVADDGPKVSCSFANNFWGKEDAGVSPLLERMHNSKVTGDELKAFYTARAQIEEEYARKLLNLARKPLGSSEAGTLRMSLDVVRGEIESMGKVHQQIAGQMKSELEEPLSAFAGGIKERRKIIQNGIEKLLKTKTQQTLVVNKARDKYESDCLKIKGYLAQGHMVMGQEERKNKAKLEKTQIQMSATSNEYEAAIKVLEETTGRWNREWKAACDKFQDLEEERLDFMKSSLWNFANVSSTVCVSDDASCEKIRLSLEDCDVEKDISNFIKESGTGQEIPDPPKFINFCRGDITDTASEVSDDGAYSVAQFQRNINPTYRTSSPGPKKDSIKEPSPVHDDPPEPSPLRASQNSAPSGLYDDLAKVPHNEYPMEGMTQFCRIGPPSDRSSIPSPTRPESRDDRSEYSNPTSHSSYGGGMSSGAQSPTKQFTVQDDKNVQKRKSGFFQNHSPFRRKSKHENQYPASMTSRNGYSAQSNAPSPTKSVSGRQSRNARFESSASPDPDPVDPRANFQLNVGNNVFDVASPDTRRKPATRQDQSDVDPIAQALADLKGVTKQSSMRVSADRYHGIATPAQSITPNSGEATPRPFNGPELRANQGRTPPPGYDPAPQSRLGAPQPAFTSRQMQQTTAQYVSRGRDSYAGPPRPDQIRPGSSQGRPPTREGRPMDPQQQHHPRAASPNPMRPTSPRPGMHNPGNRHSQIIPRATSPNPYGASQGPPPQQGRARAHTLSPQKMSPGPQGHPQQQGQMRSRSPAPGMRPGSSQSGMAMQLSQQGGAGFAGPRPTSQLYGDGPYSLVASGGQAMRPRGGSNVGQGGQGRPAQVTKDGRPILHFSRAMYVYQAAIQEELSFSKGDVLAVLRHQDDGWWEAEVCGKPGRAGLVPSNYLQAV